MRFISLLILLSSLIFHSCRNSSDSPAEESGGADTLFYRQPGGNNAGINEIWSEDVKNGIPKGKDLTLQIEFKGDLKKISERSHFDIKSYFGNITIERISGNLFQVKIPVGHNGHFSYQPFFELDKNVTVVDYNRVVYTDTFSPFIRNRTVAD